MIIRQLDKNDHIETFDCFNGFMWVEVINSFFGTTGLSYKLCIVSLRNLL